MKIIQQNLDKRNKNIAELINSLLEKNPDILFFTEFCYANHEIAIVQKLQEEKYQIILPCGFNGRDKRNFRLNAACMLAVKEGYEFEQTCRNSVCQKYRYIEGTCVSIDGNVRIKCFFAYVQQLYVKEARQYDYDDVNEFLRKAEMKSNMFFEMYRFSEENKSNHFFIGGDLNTNVDSDKARMRSIFLPLYENENVVDTCSGPTWNNERLDYALISRSLKERYECETTAIKTNSDHLALCTELKLAKKQ